MPSFLLTMRPHINEPSLLDTFLTIFFASDLFKNFSEYSYNIEKDNPCEAHFHMFFTSTLRDKEKVLNQLGVKEFKQFSAYIKNKHTDKQRCIDVQLVKKDKSRDHRLYTIGYTRKELKHSREHLPEISKNISSNELISALNYYLEMTKVDKIGQTKDIKVLSNKNAHAVILHYCEENKVMPTDPKLLTYFHRERMYTDFLSENQLSRIRNSCEETLLYEEYGATDKPMKTYEELMKENESLQKQIDYFSKHRIKQLEKENENLIKKLKEPKKYITCDENGNPTYCCQKCKVALKNDWKDEVIINHYESLEESKYLGD